jgi:hypothetical protein
MLGKPRYSQSHRSTQHISIPQDSIIFRGTYNKIKFFDNTVCFYFLNENKVFSWNSINWNFADFGKLWVYNLNYFDFLESCDLNNGFFLIKDYIRNAADLKDGMEPYPTSLRIVNWIKLCVKHQVFPTDVLRFIRSDVDRLQKKIEYHILANHILENACTLWISSIFFNDHKLQKKASVLLEAQIKEQFAGDGFHYEKSILYHITLLSKLLDCFHMTPFNSNSNKNIEDLLKITLAEGAAKIKWFMESHNFPMFNDCVEQELPHINQLLQGIESAGIVIKEGNQNTSGYFKFFQNDFVAFANYSSIGPRYQPGHAHADTFSFVLYFKKKQIIVDPGISTYEACDIRDFERSTKAHNTISYNNENSSEVWSAFRVGRRAEVFDVKVSENEVTGWHNGYRHLGAKHFRNLKVTEYGINIYDVIEERSGKNIISSIHFHPDVQLEISDNNILIEKKVVFNWSGIKEWNISDYFFAEGFN